ncbi:MAG: hypothetical protein GY950_33150, partial [bacterium]|nr:hypothetical protein [bacterium]
KKRYLGEIRKKSIRAYKGRNFTQYIQQRTPPVLDRLLKIPEGQLSLDDVLQNENFNVKEAGNTDKHNLSYLEESMALSGEINEDMEWDLRTAVIGHTHHARITTDQRDGKFFALVDCGAWIEKSTAVTGGEETVIKNAQIGVLHNNDVRIYQLQPKI